MSVTLKMADQDVQLLYDVAKNVTAYRAAVLAGKETTAFLNNFDRIISSTMKVQQLQDISGALNIALRGNQR